MEPAARGWLGTHPRAVDVGLAVLVLVLSLLAVPATPETVAADVPRLTPLVVALLVLASGALLWRRTHPVPVWAFTLLLVLVPIPTGSIGRGLPTAVIALYAVAAYGSRRLAVGCALATMAVGVVLLTRSGAVAAQDPVSYAVVAWCGLAAALGDAVRSNREVLRAALERARTAEEDRDREAERQVADERLRISRELHDVVAHHLAVVNVQMGVAEHLADSDGAESGRALRRAREASGTALREMAGLVGLLRGTVDEGVPPPAPDATDLPALVETVRAGGLDVVWHHEGPPLGGTAGHDLHLYRVVQEALTNAARHGCGAAVLRTRQGADSVEVEVTNEVDARRAPARPDAPGHGLVGMRERVALLGGDLDVGPAADQGWRVRAVLPVEPR